ncbi:C-terminal processing peptidase-3 [Pseudopedobacter saltans DSM 12145]|uniref:C-terminal processing peptidase-3 n=1 Tax=Pseudopedobacter saltans (strain ATCC 51119 / DSM 12145 / JCM 21818 / CCUG 39354 / LMG 10337 / NBRC 100064 / NCIMB 13643) TaxID=762903 RepID=F0S7Q2_PSESL|nr:S41 family peptidase [Pseudopedobacter saltans]ADY53307.1 C-terminal processing peptidase-3 [Pseudopedobacter saltans DSM 12145]
MKSLNLKKAILWGGLLVMVFGVFSFKTDLFQISKNIDILVSVYKELNMNYVDDVDPSKLMKTGIGAMLNDLDPYTEFVAESEIEDYKMKYVSTQYGGIGAGILYRDGKVYVADVFEGYPAQLGDIRAGDQLISINNQELKGKNNEEVSLLLKGAKDTPVTVKLSREGKILEKQIKRAEIKQPNVTYSGMLDNQVAYIKLDKFLENSAQEVKEAFLALKKNNPTGLVLDLRYNGGGILQEAVKIVNFFVGKDVEVVSQIGRDPNKKITYKTFANPLDAEIPLIVLINGRSASASEIVAGSLQDLDRAVIIGQRSFGKGLVQQTFNLPYNTLVKVTVAKYYTPSGRCIQSLDYTHRLEDGSVEKVADSLITEYKTKSGRLVYDGSGIYPDLFVDPYKYHQVTQTLLSKYLFFDYANQYRSSHQSVAVPKEFNLSEADYNAFIDYLKNKDFKYQTPSELLLEDFVKEASKDNRLNDVKSEVSGLQEKLKNIKSKDLNAYKPEIKRVLEAEIVQRYYFEKGRILQGFQYDNEMKKAYEVLRDKNLYSSVVQGKGEYKTIGKPGQITAKAN